MTLAAGHKLYGTIGNFFYLDSFLPVTEALRQVNDVDPNALNLNPDPGCWPNLDPGSGYIVCYQFWIFFYKKLWRKITYRTKLNRSVLKEQNKNNDTGRNLLSVWSLNGEYSSSTLHILPFIYPIFT